MNFDLLKKKTTKIKMKKYNSKLIITYYNSLNLSEPLRQIELLVLDSNTWSNLTECKQMRFGLFKNFVNKLLIYKSYNIYMCVCVCV